MTWLVPVAGGVRVRLLIQPRASRTEVVGVHGDALRIRLAAPPVDGAANEALIRFLAERTGVPRSALRLVTGAGGRRKVVEWTGVVAAQVAARLAPGGPPLTF